MCYLYIINLKKCNIHRAAGEVIIRFLRLINKIATFSKVNDCFISWKCFTVIYLQIHRHTNKISWFWSVCLWLSRKHMLNAISLVIEQRKNEFHRIAKVWFFTIYFYTLRGWYHFPDTRQDLFLTERVISQVLKTS